MTLETERLRISDGVARQWVLAPSESEGQQCHASSVLSTGDQLLSAWFAGTAEGTPDNRIWLSRRDSSGTWLQAMVIAGEGETAHWNPVLARHPDGNVWLFYKRGSTISGWSTWYRISEDSGLSWSEARELVPGDRGGRGPVKNPPVMLPDGGWLAPGSEERWSAGGTVWECFADRSDDGGASWAKTSIPVDRAQFSGAGLIQPTFWARGNTVGALMRSSEGAAYSAVSSDGGRSFSEAQPSNLPNNNSGLTVVDIAGDLLACIHNPVDESWGPRCPLSISFSTDGVLWGPPSLVLEDGRTPLDGSTPPSTTGPPIGFKPRDTGVVTDGRGEYSYPSATIHGDQLIVTYTWQRRAIVCATLPLDIAAQAATR